VSLAEATAMLERWHEFYLLAGTAAVTLAGLLFVSMSFNLEVMIHDSREHLLRHARATLMSFIYVLTMSLMFLVPDPTPRKLAVSIGVMSIIFTGQQLRFGRSAPAAVHRHERFFKMRNRILLASYALGALNAILMFVTQSPFLAYNMITIVCAVLGNAAGTSWDLLVEVGRLKKLPEITTHEE